MCILLPVYGIVVRSPGPTPQFPGTLAMLLSSSETLGKSFLVTLSSYLQTKVTKVPAGEFLSDLSDPWACSCWFIPSEIPYVLPTATPSLPRL